MLDNEQFLSLLDNVVKNIDSLPADQVTFSPINTKLNTILTKKRLTQIQEAGDLSKARHLETNCNRVSYKSNKYTRDIKEALSDISEQKILKSGLFYYPPGGYCGWHTNSDQCGKYNKRIYLVWAKEDKQSFFRYYDNKTKKIVTKYDEKGWQIRQFTLDNNKENLFWHCVGAQSDRISIGFAYA